MIDEFEKGWKFFVENSPIYSTQINTVNWIRSVDDEVKKLEDAMNSFDGMKTSESFLKGDAAEFWHAGTFNINAAFNKSTNRAVVERSHELGSVDVSTNDAKYSLKYYGDGIASAKAQATSIFQRFAEYKATGGTKTIEEYLRESGYTDINKILNDPLYSGQLRLIPADQLEIAKNFLEEKIAKEKIIRPEQVKRYKETLELLRSKIEDKDGNQSIELTKDEAEKLAKIAKEGKFKAEDYNIDTHSLMNYGVIFKESMRSGINAAVLSMVLKLGPEIYKSIDYLIKNGEIDKNQFQESGFDAIKVGAESFIKGFISSSITYLCKSGAFGEQTKSVDASIISLATVLAMNLIKNTYKVTIGEMTRAELAENFIRDSFISAMSLGGGYIGNALIKIPVLGYMVGSFVGSIVGTFVYEGLDKVAISFCIDTGFTLFGIVDQNYKLPEDIIESIGVENFEYEKMDFETFEPETFKINTFEFDNFTPENIGIRVLRRGVIGVNRIGYI